MSTKLTVPLLPSVAGGRGCPQAHDVWVAHTRHQTRKRLPDGEERAHATALSPL
jgi:hypothetical protein